MLLPGATRRPGAPPPPTTLPEDHDAAQCAYSAEPVRMTHLSCAQYHQAPILLRAHIGRSQGSYARLSLIPEHRVRQTKPCRRTCTYVAPATEEYAHHWTCLRSPHA